MSDKAILCVDDEQIVLMSLRDQIARNFGDTYAYEIASSVEEAWEVIEEFCEEGISVLLIVSDWLMPNVKGDEFLIEVHRRFPHIITIMLTGQADEVAIEKTRTEANLYACIFKPWTEDELVSTIRTSLENNRRQPELSGCS
ncbi:MAG: response regulator [Nodosilinea sp.]